MINMDHLRAARKAKGFTQEKMAGLISVSRQAYSTYETGTRDPDTQTLFLIANVLGVSVDYLLDKKQQAQNSSTRLIPLLGTVPAGTPIEAIEDIEDYIDIYPRFVKHGELFALRVQGDSMEPDLHHGDIVIIEKQEFVENGDVAVVRVNGEDVTLKRVKLTARGLMLIPSNPAYDPVYFDSDQIATLPVTIIGKVIELRRRM
jgi:repressor LexA